MRGRPLLKLRIKPGAIPWLRMRLAIIFAHWGWHWAVDLCISGVFEVIRDGSQS